MHNHSRIATRPTRFWVVAAAFCFVPTLLIVDASHTAAVGQVMFGHRGGGFRTGIGLGVGIGGMIGNQVQREQVEDSRGAPARTQTKKEGDRTRGSNTSTAKNTSKNKKKQTTTVATKKDAPDPSSKQANDQTSKPAEAPVVTRTTPTPVATPAVTPAVERPASTNPKNCSGCNELWLAIIRHQDMIAEQEKKLAATEQKFEQDVRHRDWLRSQWGLAKDGIEKDYYHQAIGTTEKTIDGLIEQIDKLRVVIKVEKARLAQQVAAYQRCVDADCSKNVAESPAAPQSNISVGAAPVNTTPQMPASVSR